MLLWIQIISWSVAALVTVINGYLLMEFFSAEVNGIMVGAIVCIVTAAYVAFVIYLILRATRK
jgi:natural resistance-associated macrophage protein